MSRDQKKSVLKNFTCMKIKAQIIRVCEEALKGYLEEYV